MANELRRHQAGVLLLLFVLSGATSLVYQVLWVRQLSLVLGSTMVAISAVVAAFMAGLALGSAFFGKRADAGGSPLFLYALLEGGIGICGLLVSRLFTALGSSALVSGWMAFGVGFVVLLVPTILMGGTLPALGRYVAGFRGPRGRLIGALYALNTAGAILGAMATGFVLIRTLGLHGTTLVVVFGNFLIFAAAAMLSRRWPATPPAAEAASREARQQEVDLLRPVTIAYFTNGFVGLGLEVVWTRAVLLFSGNTIYAFTTILTTFLLGIALGSSLVAAKVRRVGRAPELLAAFQCLIGLVAGLTPLALAAAGVPIFRAVQERTAPMGLAAQALGAYIVAGLFMLPATFLMGASFPLVARVVADHTSQVGHAVGRIYALNTLGGMLGSLLASLLLIPWIGIQRSILLFSFLSALTGFYLAVRARSRPWTRLGASVVGVLFLAVVLAPNQFQSMLERMLSVRLTFYEEGVETTVGAYDHRRAGRPVLLINNAALNDHGVVHKMLAHLPALLHPAPRRGLVLGFGVGISSQSFASHGLEVNDCVEISPEVMHAAPAFASLNGNIAARGDPHFRVHVADGRRFLLANRELYDIIALDANSGKLRNAGVGKLYTREFFELCRDRLGSDGMVTAYVSPNMTQREFKMIVRTFSDVFPNTTLWLDPIYGETCVLLGSRRRLQVDLGRWLARVQRPPVRADLAVYDLDHPGMLLSSFMLGEERLRQFARDGEVNTDDRPIMEFYALDMDAFEIDDHPLMAASLPLYQESILPRLEAQGGSPALVAVRDYVAAQERIAPLMLQAWQAWRWNQNAEAVEPLRLAASLHPQAEHLRSLLGYGRAAEMQANEALRAGKGPESVARAGLVAARRGDYARGLELLQRALADGTTGEPAARGEMHLEAARCAAALERFDVANAQLDEAERLGQKVAVDRALLHLRRGADEEAARIVEQVTPASLRPFEMGNVLRVVGALRRNGITSERTDVLEASARDLCEDFAGAWLAYGRVAVTQPSAEVQARIRICALRLALRLDMLRQTPGPSADPAVVLKGRFDAERVPAAAIPTADHASAAPWLELCDLYRRTGRPLPAYWMARAARTLAPSNAAAYVAIVDTARQFGGESIARLAADRAVRAGGGSVGGGRG